MHHFSPCFKTISSSSDFKNIDLNSVIMHHLSSMISTFSHQFQIPNIVSNSIRIHHVFPLAFKISCKFNDIFGKIMDWNCCRNNPKHATDYLEIRICSHSQVHLSIDSYARFPPGTPVPSHTNANIVANEHDYYKLYSFFRSR